MKALKKLSQNQLIGALTFVFVVLLGIGLYLANSPGEVVDDFDSNETPPLVRIDAGYNATLSGQPFYRVDDSDEDFDDSLDVCNEFGSDSYRRGIQNGWYQVVAYEDNMRVEDVIFEQIDLEDGDLMVAVLYDSEEQEWKAWPNKIILDEDGDRVELLDRDMRLKKGTVVSVSSNQNVDYCFDYEEIGSHENIDLRWNLVSRPNFEEVDYRSIWEVAFAKGGDSGVDLERYYSSNDPDDSVDVADLEADQLYWVYGGEPSVVSGGGDLPEEELVCDTYEIRVTADYSNYTPSDSSQENLETNVANSLDEQPWLYATYDDVDDFNENLERLKNEGAVVEGKCAEEEVACTLELRYGVLLSIEDTAGNSITDASVVVQTSDGDEVERYSGVNVPVGDRYQLLPEKEGDYKIIVSKGGFEPINVDVTLVKGECHVETQELKVVLGENGGGQVEENKVSVSVIDSETRTPLSGVNVFVSSSQIASNSDFNGELELSGFNDNANLIARFTGYRDERVNVSQAVDGKLVIAMNPVTSCVTTFEGSPGFGDFVGSVALGESEEFGAAAFASIDISNCDFVSDNKEGFFIKTNEMPQAISGMVGNSQVRNVLTYSEDGPGLYSLLWFNYDGLTTNASTINIRLTQTDGDEIEFTLPLKEFSSDSIDITAGATEIGNGQASVALTESENIVLVLEKPRNEEENANIVVQDQYFPSSLAMDYNISIVNDKVVMIINSAEAGEYTVEVEYARSDSQIDLMDNTSKGIYKFEVVE